MTHRARFHQWKGKFYQIYELCRSPGHSTECSSASVTALLLEEEEVHGGDANLNAQGSLPVATAWVLLISPTFQVTPLLTHAGAWVGRVMPTDHYQVSVERYIFLCSFTEQLGALNKYPARSLEPHAVPLLLIT